MSGPPDRLTFFVDRSLGRIKVVDALRAANQDVVPHDTRFAQNTRDPVWLAEVGRHGWVVLTKDKHIRTRTNELAALLDSGVAAFVLTSGNLTGEQMAVAFVKALPRMFRLLRSTPRPFVARVTAAGAAEVIAIRKR